MPAPRGTQRRVLRIIREGAASIATASGPRTVQGAGDIRLAPVEVLAHDSGFVPLFMLTGGGVVLMGNIGSPILSVGEEADGSLTVEVEDGSVLQDSGGIVTIQFED